MFSKLKTFALIAGVLAWWQSLYEGGKRWSDKRSWIPAPQPQDARFDVTAETRIEIIRKSRYFEANNAIVNRLADLYEQFTIGPTGLQLMPASGDEKWNEAAKMWFDEWSKYCDLTSRLSLSTIQTICARSQFIDGEIFILKTYGDEIQEGGRVMRRPRIQLIESHRVETPASDKADGKTIFDGVQTDLRGRPVVYWVRETNADGTETHVPKSADLMIPVAEPCRTGQYRQLPFLYPVINDLHDLDDLQLLTMGKAKELASITRVLKTASGELPNPAKLRREQVTATQQTSAGEDAEETRTKFLQRIFGSRAIAIRAGEEMSEFQNNSPSVAEQFVWSHLISRICIGTGIPKILVFPESVQGTVARGDFDVANAFFRSRSAVHAAAWTEVYLFVMDWAIRNVPELKNAPKDWRKVNVCPPRAVNVDVGHNSAAMLSELEAGATTFEDIYAPLGKHWRERLMQKAKERAFIQGLAMQFNLSPSEIAAAATADAERLAEEMADRKEEDALAA